MQATSILRCYIGIMEETMEATTSCPTSSTKYTLGTAPHTVKSYSRGHTTGFAYSDYYSYPTVTGWGQYPIYTNRFLKILCPHLSLTESLALMGWGLFITSSHAIL